MKIVLRKFQNRSYSATNLQVKYFQTCSNVLFALQPEEKPVYENMTKTAGTAQIATPLFFPNV